MKQSIEILGWLVAGYGGLGLGFAGAFHVAGLRKLDPSAQGTGIGFGLLITPGIVLFWPWLLRRWILGPEEGNEKRRVEHPISSGRLRGLHRFAWQVLCVLAPLGLAAALWMRTDPAAPIASSVRVPGLPGKVR